MSFTRTRLCWMFALLAALIGCASSPAHHRTSPEELRRLSEIADKEYRSGNLEVAARKYREVLDASPSFAPAWVRLGAIAYRRGDMNSAEQAFGNALQLDPGNAKATYNLGVIRIHQAHALLDSYLLLAPHADNRVEVMDMIGKLDQTVPH